MTVQAIKSSFWKCTFAIALTGSFTASSALAQSFAVKAGEELLISPAADSVVAASVSTRQRGLKIRRRIGRHMVASLDHQVGTSALSNTSAIQACEQYMRENQGSICEPNVTFKASATPSDSYWPWMGNMSAIQAPQAWNSATRSNGVIVAVVDTGVDYTHTDLNANIAVNTKEIANNRIDDDGNGYVDDVYGYDFSAGDSDPMDKNGHGTHVAGTIGARGNDQYGVMGVNWTASILPVRVLDADGSGSLAQVIAGIDYAVLRGARVINLSLGAPYGSRLLLEALQRAQAAGVLVVAAAGNDGADNDVAPSFPANYELEGLISVAATDNDDNMADFSNYGAVSVHLAAPGVSVLSTYLYDSHVFLSGTSMATPHVAGAAALVLGINSTLTASQVKSLLLNSADVVPQLSGLVTSGGRLNLARAVAAAWTGRTPNNYSTPGLNGMAIDLSSARGSAKNSRFVQFRAEVYSLSSAQSLEGIQLQLVCGRRTVARATSNAAGLAQFKRVARDPVRSKYCYAVADHNGYLSYSNPRALNARKTK